MLDLVVASLGWVLVAVVPGFLLSFGLRPAAGIARNLALSPIVGIGLTMAVGRLLELFGVAIRSWTVLPISIGLPVLLVVLQRGEGGAASLRRLTAAAMNRDTADLTIDRRLLLLAFVAGLAIWAYAVPSASAVIPNTDGEHHGLFVSRIMRLHTLDPHKILAGDLATGKPSFHYYPLALHLSAAVIGDVTGVGANAVLTAGTVLAAAVVLPCGTYLLTRRLVPGAAPVAGIAAFVSSTFPWFPFAPMFWGDVPLIMAMSVVPASVDAAWLRERDGHAARLGPLIAVIGYGLFESHNSELVTAAILCLVLVAVEWRTLDALRRRTLLGTYAIAAGLFALFAVPELSRLVGAVQERSSVIGQTFVSGGNPLVWLVAGANPIVGALAAIGLWTAIRRRMHTGWLVCAGVFFVLFLTAIPSHWLLTPLTLPWYSVTARVSFVLMYFECTYAAIGVVRVARALKSRLQRARESAAQLVRMVVIGFAALGVLLLVFLPSTAFLRYAYTSASPVGADQRAGFAWLAVHVRPGERVLNDFEDDSAWMETLDRVSPVFGVYPAATPIARRDVVWGGRWYLFTHAAQLASDTRAQQEVRTWRVAYVYVSSDMIKPFKQKLVASELRRSPVYQQVWQRGPVTIFKIDLPSSVASG